MKCIVNGKEYTKEQMAHLESFINGIMNAAREAIEYIKDTLREVFECVKSIVDRVYWYVFISSYKRPLDNFRDNIMKYGLFDNMKTLIHQP